MRYVRSFLLALTTLAFFLLVLFAALTSSIALTESAVSTFEDELGWDRHQATVLIGVIMLLVPGIPFTNAIRDILLGDIISGSLRLVEAVLLAAMLALGMMAAIWLMGGAA